VRILKKICLLLILLFFFSPLWAQSAEYKINNTMFLPPQFYVGDTVELRIHFTVSEDKELSLPAAMPELSWITIKGMELQKVRGFYELRVVFSSFQPGTRAFPSLDLGSVVIEGIRIHTTSVLQEGEEPFAQAFNPVNLPGTRLLLGFGSALLLFGPLILVIFGGKTLRILRDKFQLKQRRRPYRRFLKRMTELGNRMNKIERDEFYTILAREFRTYISQRLKKNFIPETTRETKKLLYKEFPSAGFLEPLFSILEYGDRIRFGDKATKRERKDPDLITYKKTVEQIEETIHHREQALRIKRKKKGVVYVGS